MKSLDRKSNETDSPKTPGGISKSLLTPIRRLGLSRKWKKSGTSPFVSPLAGNIIKNNENEEEEKRPMKRKICVDEETQNLPFSPIGDSKEVENNKICSTPQPSLLNTDAENTPVRRVAVSRKKCKSLISSPIGSKNSKVDTSMVNQNDITILNQQKSNDFSENKQAKDTRPEQKSSTKIRNTSKSPKKLLTVERIEKIESKEKTIETEDKGNNLDNKEMCINDPKVPNLTKECIVVIQKKINIQKNYEIHRSSKENYKENNSMSQTVFDSDSDDVPLSSLNRKDPKQKPENLNNENLDDDFVDTKINNRSRKEISNKTESSNNQRALSSKTIIEEKTMQKKKQTITGKMDQGKVVVSSQKCKYLDDDDDDFELNKKTILIRKSYDKVTKPSKSKSTGSITQKDIDELRDRIEMKKKLLVAKSMTEDTEELRGLIKKWQKGCQDALMELLDLMRKKIPDQSNMNYSYILEMLKIPPSLVGYDEENECFNTPDDDSILTAAFNDL